MPTRFEIDEVPEMMRGPLHEDPFGRWAAGEEPVREVTAVSVVADVAANLLIVMPSIEIDPPVLPEFRFEEWGEGSRDEPSDPGCSIHLRGRWNATWAGDRRLANLTLDLFAPELNEMVRVRFEASDPVDLLAAYGASFPGTWQLQVRNAGEPEIDEGGRIVGHRASVRDQRLAMQLAARYPGICRHMAAVDRQLLIERDAPTGSLSAEIFADLTAARESIDDEPVPGAKACLTPEQIRAGAVLVGDDFEPSPGAVEQFGATLDTYSLLGMTPFDVLPEADLLRAPPSVVNSLAAQVTFADAIEAIRASDPDRLPFWIDFTDDGGEPQWRQHAEGLRQPLYGAFVLHEEDEAQGGPFHAVIPVGRTVALSPEAMPTCPLAVGSDDSWRYPLPEHQIGLITAHRGGVVVRHVNVDDFGVTVPPIESPEFSRELAGHFAHSTEWVLARVGAILNGIEAGLLRLDRHAEGKRTFNLTPAPAAARPARSNGHIDAQGIAGRLRELGSLYRVAKVDGVDPASARAALEHAGIDPLQVLRDEVARRWRETGSIEAIVSGLHLHRGQVENSLRKAGISFAETVVPHDVTDPEVQAAITAYREHGTLHAAGDAVGVSGETIRRRLQRAGLSPGEVGARADERATRELVKVFEEENRSLASTAARLGIDPRTVKARLSRAGVEPRGHGGATAARVAEAARLYELVGSQRRVAALMGVSPSTVGRLLAGGAIDTTNGGPKIGDAALDQAQIAYAEHGSVRAAARATGLSPGGFAYRLQRARDRNQTGEK